MEYLKKYRPDQTLYLMARDEVKADFAASGFQLTEEDPDVCVLAYDTTMDFAKLRKFNECLVNGSFYVATHPDSVCPAAGISPPDVGSIIKLFECSSSRLPDVICGKPYPAMGEALLGLVNADKSEIAMVGDRLNTDIKFANNSGFTGVLVLTGETKKEMLPSNVAKPDIVLDSLNDLMRYL
jgi:HAD superfamily hydrolase (TIGR01450 family)